MASQVVRDLIDRVAERRKGDDLWYCELIIGFAACNHGELAGLVYQKALQNAVDDVEKKEIWSRIREAILKAMVYLGQARLLAAELALFEVLKLEDVDQETPQRDWKDDEHGKMKAVDWLTTLSGTEFADRFVTLADERCPDLSHYLITLSNGHVMTDERVLDMVETERLILLALMAQNVGWWAQSHYRALIRVGGTKEMAHAANELALEITKTFGIKIDGASNVDELCDSAI
ncbi:hypothetical protein JX265_000574 [Neoarthrinium moseri]|uniref:Uncharacterized protein n=1 Tax=Neoarthrinium moseri TaxID=1658444 RepID=A0A9Q0AV15_9PEZI|nr:uncharacterized protein JN550_001673 [Neoarthrinium moseri]KAI1854170.1 hypothetical protein JX266_001311 [Neoarthrinium moseri]KAI1876177.1 hypothetical protein JN550_001673 [Neoarthrinium moseri]KAI1881748.1 hypothetical protein JX265_000574 [Neoarthrinium moseri]